MRGQRATGELQQPPAAGERAEIQAEEAQALDEGGHLRLRRTVVAGIEQHAAPAKTRVFVDFVVEAFQRERLAERFAGSIG